MSGMLNMRAFTNGVPVSGFYSIFDSARKGIEETLERRRISKFIAAQAAAREAYDKAKKLVRDDDPASLENLKVRKQDVMALSQQVLAVRRLIQVMPDAAPSLLRQLIENEKVHLLKAEDEAITDDHIRHLIDYRLGDETGNKDCQALIVPTKQGPRILGGIFRYHATIPEEGGMIDVRHLPGNVDAIKSAPVEELTGKENVTGYWTISSGWDGSGPVLVSDLSKVTPAGRLETTISPIRGFTSRHNRDELLAHSDDDIRAMVVDYLINEKDLVRNFHMGNGAYLAWIHVNRDVPPESEDWIMVNYLYNRAELTHNQKFFKEGILPMAPVLYRTLGLKQTPRAYNVGAQALISKPSMP